MKKNFVITEYTVPSEKISSKQEDVIFVMLSDLHNVCIGYNNEELIRAIDQVNPQGVLIGGDMLVGKPGFDFAVACNLIEELCKNYKVYYANGNHEYRMKIYPEKYLDMWQRYKEKLLSFGVILLENDKCEFQIGGVPISVYGLEIDASYYSKKKHMELKVSKIKEWIGEPDKSRFNILLAHNPKYVAVYGQWGADVILCGHYHGGMIRIGKQGIISPYLKVFPKYSYGKYQINNSTIIVSGGLGEHTIPIRYFNPRELVCIRITSKG